MRWPWEPKEIKVVAPELDELLDKATYIAEKVDDLVATMNRQLDAAERKQADVAEQVATGQLPKKRAVDDAR